jgi:2-C-methyl-D-erythritol 4-phosphate cytidylyltransferase
MNAVAVVLASGSGQRFDSTSVPKHLTHILGVPILVWTLKSAIQSKLFSSITVVTRKDDICQTEKIIKEYFSDDILPIRLTEGSTARIQSFFLGLADLTKADLVSEETIVAIFDSNRPFTPINQLQDLYELALEHECSCPARAVVNGVARMDSGRILEVPDKSSYVEFVTPEFMKLNTLKVCIEKHEEGFNSLVEYTLAMGFRPAITEACSLNIKLTFPEDKTYLEGLALKKKLEKPIKYNLANNKNY